MLSKSIKNIMPYRPFHRAIDETLKIPEKCWPLLYLNFTRVLQFSSTSPRLRRISCHVRNHSQASCEYSLTIFLCCQHHSEYSLLGSKFSTNLLFAASKCHVTIQQRGSSRCSKWPNRMGSLQW